MIRRVVVTGVGLVTPLGVGKDDFARQLFGGQPIAPGAVAPSAWSAT